MTEQYTVIGNPIAHSKSPLIHQAFARQTQQAMSYDKTLVALDGFVAAISALQQQGIKGANVTVPFKEEAFALAQHLTERARRAAAVNTLVFQDDGSILGDNTDGIGLVGDLLRQAVVLAERRILLLGAGGAAKGVILPLLEQHPAQLVVANRTASKAAQLAMSFADVPGAQVSGGGFADIGERPFDVIINATSASIRGDVPPITTKAIAEHTVCYDMMYGEEETAFLQWAANNGCRSRIDGLGMLVGQAAEAFRVWCGVMPDVVPVIAQLR